MLLRDLLTYKIPEFISAVLEHKLDTQTVLQHNPIPNVWVLVLIPSRIISRRISIMQGSATYDEICSSDFDLDL